MAKSKIQTEINFKESGADKAAAKVDALASRSSGAASKVDELNSKLSKIGVGVGISSTIESIRAIGSAVSFVKDTVVGAGSAIYDFISGQAQQADNIAKLSRSLGMTTSEFEKFDYAAQRGGMSSEEFTNGLEKFSVTVAKASAGEKKFKGLFDALGVSLRDGDGRLKTNASLMLEVADAYNKVTNAQDKNRVSAELFGQKSMLMSTVLEGGSKGLNELMSHRADLRGILTTDDAKAAEDFDDKMLDVFKSVEGVKRAVAFAIIPSVNKLLDKITSWWTSNGSAVIDKLSGWSGRLAGFIDYAADKFPAFASSMGTVYDVVSQVVDSIGLGKIALAGLAAFVTATAVPAFAAVSAVAGAIGVSVSSALPVIAGVSAGVTGLAVTVSEVVKNWDMLWSTTSDDWLFVFREIKAEVREIVEWWRKVPVIGSFIDWAVKKPEEVPASSPVALPPSSYSFDSAPTQEPARDPSGAMVMRNYSEQKTTTTNKLVVDFNGVPRGTEIKRGDNFDPSVIDYSAGYVFGE